MLFVLMLYLFVVVIDRDKDFVTEIDSSEND
jgi:hypothetical protein